MGQSESVCDVGKHSRPYEQQDFQSLAPSAPGGGVDVVALLKKVSFLQHLPEHHSELARTCTRQLYAPLQLLVCQGDLGDASFIILRGDALVEVAGCQAGVFPVGSHFGEGALLRHETHHVTVRAKSELEVLKITRQDLEKTGLWDKLDYLQPKAQPEVQPEAHSKAADVGGTGVLLDFSQSLQVETCTKCAMEDQATPVDGKPQTADLGFMQEERLGDHAVIMSALLSMQKADRDRIHGREAATEAIQQLFMVKVLCTAAAWFIQSVFHQAVLLISESIGGKATSTKDTNYLDMVSQFVYTVCLVLLAPPVQYLLRNVAPPPAERPSKLVYSVLLLKTAIPMTLAWAFKNSVSKLLTYTGERLWDEVIVATALLVVVTCLQSIPQVRRAQQDIKEKRDAIIKRYLSLPFTLMLSLAYALNSVMRFGITELKESAGDMARSKALLGILVQWLYFQVVLTLAICIIGWWDTRSKLFLERGETHDHKVHAEALRKEAEADVGDLLVHALTFLVGWSLNDLLDTVYYPFLLNVGSEKAADVPQVWLFGIGVTMLLNRYMLHLSASKSAQPSDTSYKLLIKSALALTVGSAWQNVCSSTTAAFISDWKDRDPEFNAAALVVYLITFVVCWYVMTLIFCSVSTDVMHAKMQRECCDRTYPIGTWSGDIANAAAVFKTSAKAATRD